jgi:large subunit ribosomal protein L11
MDFCKVFNDKTKNYKPGVPLRVEIYTKADKSYTWISRNPSIKWFLRRLTGISKFDVKNRGTGLNGTISKYQLYEIAKIKQQDEGSKHLDLKEIYAMVVNHAYVCGLTIV